MAGEPLETREAAGAYPDPQRHSARILEALDRHGTPLMFCETRLLAERYRALQDSLDRSWRPNLIAYSFKTNYDVARAGVFDGLGGWAEVVSGREYDMARSLGFPGKRIVFNGPYKTDAELARALREGAILNLNDHDELDRLIALAPAIREPSAVGLRISSTLDHYGHSRFGFSLENGEALDAVRKLARQDRVRLAGLHSHLHGDVDEAEIYAVAARRAAEFACEHLPGGPASLAYLDMGGGFPAPTPKPYSRGEWHPEAIEVYVAAIEAALRPYFPVAAARPRLILEPGRYLTNDAVILVSEVVHVGRRADLQVVNSNATISMVPLTHYRPQIIKAYDLRAQPRGGAESMTAIYGASCRENDKLYEGPFVALKPGDLLVHFGIGAYNSTLSPDFIFDRPRMEVL